MHKHTCRLVTSIFLANVLQLHAEIATHSWMFTDPAQYIVSSSTLVEVAGNAARFKLQSSPWISPVPEQGLQFHDDLLGFTDRLSSSNGNNAVRYQISQNNGANWYAWIGNQWTDVTTAAAKQSGWQNTTPADMINIHIGTFTKQQDGQGGVFTFKAFFPSDGTNPIALQEVRLTYVSDRMKILVPNGQENDTQAWLMGVPYIIQWSSSDATEGPVKLEYSLDGGTTWFLIASNVVNVVGVNKYQYWTTPAQPSHQCRVRVTAMRNPNVSDLSDGDFSIGERFRILPPNGGGK